MYCIFKKTIILVAIAALLIIPLGSHALAQEQIKKTAPDGGVMVADLLVARPLGVSGMFAGFFLFIATVPFFAPGGNVGTAWEQMVDAPANYTFARPIGDF
ncbi:MAG: hypothetical protein NTX36_06835 [Proteobacteria bacterium]|nr:hypothetical protein [Pseudomonadota bacterium]